MRISCNLHEDVFPFGKLRKIVYILNTVVISDGKEVDIAGINKRNSLKGKINEVERGHEARNIVDFYTTVPELRRLNNLERIWRRIK